MRFLAFLCHLAGQVALLYVHVLILYCTSLLTPSSACSSLTLSMRLSLRFHTKTSCCPACPRPPRTFLAPRGLIAMLSSIAPFSAERCVCFNGLHVYRPSHSDLARFADLAQIWPVALLLRLLHVASGRRARLIARIQLERQRPGQVEIITCVPPDTAPLAPQVLPHRLRAHRSCCAQSPLPPRPAPRAPARNT